MDAEFSKQVKFEWELEQLNKTLTNIQNPQSGTIYLNLLNKYNNLESKYNDLIKALINNGVISGGTTPGSDPNPNPDPDPDPEPDPNTDINIVGECILLNDYSNELHLSLNTNVNLAKLQFDIDISYPKGFYELDINNGIDTWFVWDEPHGTSFIITPHKIKGEDLDLTTSASNNVYSFALQRKDKGILYSNETEDSELFMIVKFLNYVYYKTKITIKNIVGYEYDENANNHIGRQVIGNQSTIFTSDSDPDSFDIYTEADGDIIKVMFDNDTNVAYIKFDLELYTNEDHRKISLNTTGQQNNVSINQQSIDQQQLSDYVNISENNGVYTFEFYNNGNDILEDRDSVDPLYTLCEINLENVEIERMLIVSLKNNIIKFNNSGNELVSIKLKNDQISMYEDREQSYIQSLLENRFDLRIFPQGDITYDTSTKRFSTDEVGVKIIYTDENNNITEFITLSQCRSFIKDNSLLDGYLGNSPMDFASTSNMLHDNYTRPSNPTFTTYSENDTTLNSADGGESLIFYLNKSENFIYDNILFLFRIGNRTVKVWTNFGITNS